MPERVRPMAKSSSDSPTSMMKMTSAATRNHDDGSVPRQPTHRAAMAARLTAKSAVILPWSRPRTAPEYVGNPPIRASSMARSKSQIDRTLCVT